MDYIMVRGTRLLEGPDVILLRKIISEFTGFCHIYGCEEIILPSMWEQSTFTDKAGPEILNQMYTFKDKGDRDLCLLPEGTAPIIELYKTDWEKTRKKPVKLFYVQRFYRYERPQEGRYREFWQFGVEVLGPKPEIYAHDLQRLARACLYLGLKLKEGEDFIVHENVPRGLNYYTKQENCFEIEMPSLGAQKQILGGGQYDCGIGFAFGLDRILLGLKNK